MKKPFIYAFSALVYIIFIVTSVQFTTTLPQHNTPSILIPMVMLSLFVFSAAVMGFLFLSEPLQLYLDGKKHEAIIFFGKILACFASFIVLFLIILLLK